MDFNLTREQQIIQRAAREFAEKEIEPIAAEVEREGKVPPDMTKKMAMAELLGMVVPREYGGSQAGQLNYILAVEQIHYPVSACTWIMTSCNMMGKLICLFGTEEQKNRYVRPSCQGEMLGTMAFTEPATGTDPRMLTTTAVLDGDYWVINGIKRFASWAASPGPIVVYAKSDGDRISAFLFDKNIPGYSVSKAWELIGVRGLEIHDIYLENVRVPKESLLGERGNAYEILLKTVGGGRQAIAIRSVACAQAALDEAIKYAKQRMLRRGPMTSLQGIRWLLAEMATKVEAARWLVYRAAFLHDQGVDVGAISAQAKLFATRVGAEVADEAVRLHGAYGYTKEFKIERIWRAAKQSEIAEGTSEIQRSILGAFIVGEY